ncbi:MAG: DUF4363 family protein [Oscillospiraceae bacterium]|nr:DUF4363 family protein [Oscillospiraceae bacterium]
MKRSWFGFILLILLLILSLVASYAMDQIHEEAANHLQQASQLGMSGNWPAAAYQIALVRHQWERWHFLRSVLADHTPIEAIEEGFSGLEVYGEGRERIAFAALCRELAQQMKALADAHRLNLHNLL